MVHFEKLRLNGFKSFVDRTELEIGPGLNGVVGPNGCGKSNLLEALRWVMGENSPKRMRGDGMEDVIFNGTSSRSARNIAEVSLLLNNEKRDAPAAYNKSDEIEVIRRIERDHGSNYKINGKTVRMRDVQMLFADTVTGANSPAMVSQGRITAIINAKPQERRMILEESAGISGLFARRHEAELRLKAASTNLTRLEDILGGFEKQLNSLKRQARQASRYKNINAQIRQLDILIAYLEWRTLAEKKKDIGASFTALDQIVAEKMASVAQLTKTQTTQAEELPQLRKKEAETSAALQTQKIALQRIEDESARIDKMKSEAQEQLTQSESDFNHESTSLEENSHMLEKIEIEENELATLQQNSAKDLAEKEKRKDSFYEEVEQLQASHTVLMEGAAESRARQNALEESLKQDRARKETLVTRQSALKQEHTELVSGAPDMQMLGTLQKDISALEGRISSLNKMITEQGEQVETEEAQSDSANKTLQEYKQEKSKIDAELDLLASLLEEGEEDTASSILESTQAQPGFEKALSRALGDSLLASLDESAQHFWQKRAKGGDALPALPTNVEPIAPYIKAPEALDLALSQIGCVETLESGQAAFSTLAAGQALVSKDGHYWRWDGYCIKASATDRNAQHLEYKNKYVELQKKGPEIEASITKSEAVMAEAEAHIEALKKKRKESQESLDTMQREHQSKANELRNLEGRASLCESESKRLESMLSNTSEDLKAVDEKIAEGQKALEQYKSAQNDVQLQKLDDVKADLIEAREKYQEALRRFDMHEQQQKTREARLHAIADERLNLKNKIIRSKERIKSLEERIAENTAKLETLKAQPRSFESEKESLLSKISELEIVRSTAAEKLSVREQEVMETSRALKTAENNLGEAREKRAHAQATLSALQDQLQEVEASIEEKFQIKPADLPLNAAIDVASANLVELPSYKQERDTLIRDREAIGPVNLRAEEEATTLEKEVGGLLNERNDLSQAIDELQSGITKINKEARERLLAAFDHVNGHFQHLFKRLFHGGDAKLVLIESDDPLGAGLEIMAQPPGKSLQALSLLSGGEQTMASIALIFAMFLTNPSPICVLDEIDAPLDDANVDRVCDLLEEIAERGDTRFMIITHHRLTMARMHRLYGVTMSEKGVSQLVSVDLQQSFSFLDEAA